MSKFISTILAVLTLAVIFGVGVYNRIGSGEEDVTAKWSEVLKQYQRRADLVPSLVDALKGITEQEKEVLTQLVDARSKVTSIQLSAENLNDPIVFKQFTEVQTQLTNSLKDLMVAVERYPDLKGDKRLIELEKQLDSAENMMTVARKRYNLSVDSYNLSVQKFPGSLFAGSLGYTVRSTF